MFNLIFTVKEYWKTNSVFLFRAVDGSVFLFRAVDVIFFTWIKWIELNRIVEVMVRIFTKFMTMLWEWLFIQAFHHSEKNRQLQTNEIFAVNWKIPSKAKSCTQGIISSLFYLLWAVQLNLKVSRALFLSNIKFLWLGDRYVKRCGNRRIIGTNGCW